jgi:hypothetical protein
VRVQFPLRLICFIACAGCTQSDDVPAPAIASVSPDHAPAGASVMIAGQGFCQQPDTGGEDPLACANMGLVEFGQVPGSIGSYTDDMISVEVPALASGPTTITVAVAGRRSNRADFVVDGP